MFEELNAFALVVEQSSLNRASKLLNLSQPALSRKISKLEDELGVALFHRRGKRLELTSVGQLAYTFAVEQKQEEENFSPCCPNTRMRNRVLLPWEPA